MESQDLVLFLLHLLGFHLNIRFTPAESAIFSSRACGTAGKAYFLFLKNHKINVTDNLSSQAKKSSVGASFPVQRAFHMSQGARESRTV
jgi:hypothetical protein